MRSFNDYRNDRGEEDMVHTSHGHETSAAVVPPAYSKASDTCKTCGGQGWIVTGQSYGNPYGEQEQCPDCPPANLHDEMLTALRSMQTWVRHWQHDVDCNLLPTVQTLAKAADELAAIIAKATGRAG
jgi:hypothetical protein